MDLVFNCHLSIVLDLTSGQWLCAVFWIVPPCSLERIQPCGVICHLHLRVKEFLAKQEANTRSMQHCISAEKTEIFIALPASES
jgi:hypothetical protein